MSPNAGLRHSPLAEVYFSASEEGPSASGDRSNIVRVRSNKSALLGFHTTPLSPVVANLYMETFETKVLDLAPLGSKMWVMYVDDTFNCSMATQ